MRCSVLFGTGDAICRQLIVYHLRPAAGWCGDVEAGLYGYLIVHVVDTGPVGGGCGGPLRSVIVRRRHHLHRIRHLQCSNERHWSAACVARGGRSRRYHCGFPFHLRRLVRREDGYAASHCRMVRCPWRVRVQLLRRTGWIRPVVIVRRGRPLGRRLVRRRRDLRPRWGRIAARRVIFPRVDATLGGTGQFSDVIHCVVRSGIRVVTATLADQLALGQETPLGAVTSHDGGVAAAGASIVSLLHIVIRRCVVHSYKIWPTNLRRRTWVRSVTQTSNVGSTGTSNDEGALNLVLVLERICGTSKLARGVGDCGVQIQGSRAKY